MWLYVWLPGGRCGYISINKKRFLNARILNEFCIIYKYYWFVVIDLALKMLFFYTGIYKKNRRKTKLIFNKSIGNWIDTTS